MGNAVVLFGSVAAGLVIVAAILYVRRLREVRSPQVITDDMIERIETIGVVDVDDPLDLRDIAVEEERFWEEEPWEEPEEL